MKILTHYVAKLDDWLERNYHKPWDTGADLMPDLPAGRPLKMRDIRKLQKLTLQDLGVDKLHCCACDTYHWPNRSCNCYRLNKNVTQS